MSNAETGRPETKPMTNDYRPSTWMGELTGFKFAIALFSFFGFIFGANAIMAYFALSTFDGVETDDAYRKGRAYNHVLEADAAQTALGWQVAHQIRTDASADGKINVRADLTISNTDGSLVALDHIAVDFWRPTVQGMDVTEVLLADERGHFVTSVILERAGIWDMRVRAQSADGTPFYHEERLTLLPAESGAP